MEACLLLGGVSNHGLDGGICSTSYFPPKLVNHTGSFVDANSMVHRFHLQLQRQECRAEYAVEGNRPPLTLRDVPEQGPGVVLRSGTRGLELVLCLGQQYGAVWILLLLLSSLKFQCFLPFLDLLLLV